MERLADLTDGKTYTVHDSDTSYAFSDAFDGALTYQPSILNTNLRFKLYERKIALVTKRIIEGEFLVDQTVGRNLVFTIFDVQRPSLIASIQLVSPDGKEFNQVEFDSTAAYIFVDLAKVWRDLII